VAVITVLKGVTVVDPASSQSNPGLDVIIDGERILEVVTSRDHGSAMTVDAAGQFVVPGFVDMHAHPLEQKDPSGTLSLMLAYGITGYRQMSGSSELLRSGAGPTQGPRLLARCGDLLTPLTAGDAKRAIQSIREQKNLGADFVKAGMISAEVFYEAQLEANKLDIPILGHLPNGVDVRRVVGEGMRSIEHLGPMTALVSCCCRLTSTPEYFGVAPELPVPPAFLTPLLKPIFARVLPRLILNPMLVVRSKEIDKFMKVADRFDDTEAGELADLLRTNGTWQVPTLVRVRAMQRCDDPAYAADPNLRYVEPKALKQWHHSAAKFSKKFTSDQRQVLQHFNEVLLRLTKIFADAGVGMLTGSDSGGAAWTVPGPSLHEEFRLLAQAGIAPARVLQMATSDAAHFLGRSASLGKVAAGYDADLVLLNADPLESVDNFGHIVGVVRSGTHYDQAAVNRIREEVAAARTAA
jgi:hypothetical protein